MTHTNFTDTFDPNQLLYIVEEQMIYGQVDHVVQSRMTITGQLLNDCCPLINSLIQAQSIGHPTNVDELEKVYNELDEFVDSITDEQLARFAANLIEDVNFDTIRSLFNNGFGGFIIDDNYVRLGIGTTPELAYQGFVSLNEIKNWS